MSEEPLTRAARLAYELHDQAWHGLMYDLGLLFAKRATLVGAIDLAQIDTVQERLNAKLSVVEREIAEKIDWLYATARDRSEAAEDVDRVNRALGERAQLRLVGGDT